jgi:ubiquitin carboxyl-terminal hydrolase 1
MNAMNDTAAFEDYVQHASTYKREQQSSSGLSPVITIIAFTIFACLAWPILLDVTSGDGRLRRYFHGLQEMASRMSFGLIRRPLAQDTSALTSVFGLKTSAVSSLKNLGTDTFQRGIGGIRSIVKGTGSELPAGLGNWDNSCYQNSVIQGLASLRSLPDFLRRVAARLKTGDGMNEALLEMVQRLNDEGNNGRQLWLPTELKTMSTWQQQDAQEYFSKILEKVDKEALRVASKSSSSKASLGLQDMGDELPKEEEKANEEGEILHNPLEGMIAQRVGCKSCGHSDGLSLIPFNCLTVPLGHNQLYDIRDCLDEYTKLEEIDGVQCPKCTLIAFRAKLEHMVANASSDALRHHVEERLHSVIQALNDEDFSDNAITKKCAIPKKQWVESTKTKQAVVARAPQGLVIHVNRSMFNEYTGAQTKNPATVRFPLAFGLGHWMLGNIARSSSLSSEVKVEEGEEQWSMDPYRSMLPESDPAAEDDTAALAARARYELRAVVTHFGRHENGHYVCYRKHPCLASEDEEENEEAWWRLSDDDVTRVGEDFVLRQGAVFMLFYEKIEEPYSEQTVPIPAGVIVNTAKAGAEMVDAKEAAQIPLPAADDGADIESTPIDDGEALAQPLLNTLENPLLAPLAKEQPPSPRQLPTPRESVAESVTESDIDSIADDQPISGPSTYSPPAIRMRTANVLVDDKNQGSSESLLLGNRMVSAS